MLWKPSLEQQLSYVICHFIFILCCLEMFDLVGVCIFVLIYHYFDKGVRNDSIVTTESQLN